MDTSLVISFMAGFLGGHAESTKTEIGIAQDDFIMGLAAKMRNKERSRLAGPLIDEECAKED